MTTTPRNARATRTTPRDLALRDAVDERRPEPEELEEDDFDELDQAKAQETEAEGHYVTARLAGEDLRIIPPGAWRQSWQTALARGQFNIFAEKVVHPDDIDIYFEIDPTNDEFEAFVVDAANRSGESLGKSRGPPGPRGARGGGRSRPGPLLPGPGRPGRCTGAACRGGACGS